MANEWPIPQRHAVATAAPCFALAQHPVYQRAGPMCSQKTSSTWCSSCRRSTLQCCTVSRACSWHRRSGWGCAGVRGGAIRTPSRIQRWSTPSVATNPTPASTRLSSSARRLVPRAPIGTSIRSCRTAAPHGWTATSAEHAQAATLLPHRCQLPQARVRLHLVADGTAGRACRGCGLGLVDKRCCRGPRFELWSCPGAGMRSPTRGS